MVESDEVTRFLAKIGASQDQIWTPGAADSPQQRSIGEIVTKIADRYRQSDMMIDFSRATHQVFGEISRTYTKKNDPEKADDYPDSVPHVDFVPPNLPGWVMFLSDINPTRGHNGSYSYLGNLQVNYRDEEILRELRFGSGGQWPKPTPGQPGKIMFSKDARTLLHERTHFEGWRTFMRMFIGPVEAI